MRVLFVDDEPNLVWLAKRHLTKGGFTVETANDGTVALALIQENPPDILICDFSRDFELIKAIRADARFASLQIIILVFGQQMWDAQQILIVELRQLILELGIDDFLFKTPNWQQLIQAVQRAAERVTG